MIKVIYMNTPYEKRSSQGSFSIFRRRSQLGSDYMETSAKTKQHKQNELKHAYKIKSHTFLRTGCLEQTNGQMAFQKIPRHISVLLGFLFVKTIQGCRVSRQPDRKRITRKNMLSAIQSYIIYNLQLLAGK